MQSAFKSFGYVFYLDRFRRIVANSAGRPQKNHGGGDFFGEDHGVVAGAAGQTMRLAARAADSFLGLLDEKRVHRYGALAQQNALPER
jgi:hypothetical protein